MHFVFCETFGGSLSKHTTFNVYENGIIIVTSAREEARSWLLFG